MKTILAFREKHEAERFAFRGEMESLLVDLAKARSSEMQLDVLSQKRRTIQRLMIDHRARLKDIGIVGLWSFLTISFPAAMSSLPEQVTNYLNPTALGVAGVAIGTAACWAKIRDDRRKLTNDNPWHYALSLQRSFG